MDGDGFMEAVIATFDGYVRLTSWLFTKSGGVEFGTTINKSS